MFGVFLEKTRSEMIRRGFVRIREYPLQGVRVEAGARHSPIPAGNSSSTDNVLPLNFDHFLICEAHGPLLDVPMQTQKGKLLSGREIRFLQGNKKTQMLQ